MFVVEDLIIIIYVTNNLWHLCWHTEPVNLSLTWSSSICLQLTGPGGVLGQVSDRDAPHRPSTRNATRVIKGGRNYRFCPIFMKNRGWNTTFSSFLLKYGGQNTTFSSFLLKYRGRNSTNFPETWKRGVETEEHIYSNLHRVSTG